MGVKHVCKVEGVCVFNQVVVLSCLIWESWIWGCDYMQQSKKPIMSILDWQDLCPQLIHIWHVIIVSGNGDREVTNIMSSNSTYISPESRTASLSTSQSPFPWKWTRTGIMLAVMCPFITFDVWMKVSTYNVVRKTPVEHVFPHYLLSTKVFARQDEENVSSNIYCMSMKISFTLCRCCTNILVTVRKSEWGSQGSLGGGGGDWSFILRWKKTVDFFPGVKFINLIDMTIF